LMQQHPDLAYLINRWPGLPEHVKHAIMTLIQTATEGKAHE